MNQLEIASKFHFRYGLVLYQAAGAIEEAQLSGNVEAMQKAMAKLKSWVCSP